jgi:hypothetical protein
MGNSYVNAKLRDHHSDLEEDILKVNTVATRIRNLRSSSFLFLSVNGRDWTVFSGITLACAIYGGLHLVAWNAHFPARAERILWRVSGIGIASFGLVYLPFMTLGAVLDRHSEYRMRDDKYYKWRSWRSSGLQDHQPARLRYRGLHFLLVCSIIAYLGYICPCTCFLGSFR